jgi:hypothetical protein
MHVVDKTLAIAATRFTKLLKQTNNGRRTGVVLFLPLLSASFSITQQTFYPHQM